MVARWSSKPKVEGSSPSRLVFFFWISPALVELFKPTGVLYEVRKYQNFRITSYYLCKCQYDRLQPNYYQLQALGHSPSWTSDIIRIINRSTDVGVSRTDLSLDNYHCQVILLVKQIAVQLLLLVRQIKIVSRLVYLLCTYHRMVCQSVRSFVRDCSILIDMSSSG